jgi:hypothetical protein
MWRELPRIQIAAADQAASAAFFLSISRSRKPLERAAVYL